MKPEARQEYDRGLLSTQELDASGWASLEERAAQVRTQTSLSNPHGWSPLSLCGLLHSCLASLTNVWFGSVHSGFAFLQLVPIASWLLFSRSCRCVKTSPVQVRSCGSSSRSQG